MVNSSIRASTLPELLVTMIVSGILIMLTFEGLEMVRRSVRTVDIEDFGESLLQLQREEYLEYTTDSSVVVNDLRIYYRAGDACDTVRLYGRSE